MITLGLGAFTTLIGSYLLILWLRRTLPRERKVEHFLFAGNRPLLAVSSGVGAMFSYSLAGTALLAAGYVYGWQVCGPIVVGACLGLLTYLRLLNRPTISSVTAAFSDEDFAKGASYPQAIAETSGKELHFCTLSYLLIGYTAMLIAEIAVIRVTLTTIMPGHPQEAELILLVLLFVCFGYVFAGGFIGILISDHAQLIVIALFVLSSLVDVNWNSIWDALPSPTAAQVTTQGLLRVFLLLSALIGAFSITLGNADHWYRTAGTLPKAQAKKVLIVVTVATTLMGGGLIIAGSFAHNLSALEPSLGYDLTLTLLAKYAQGLNPTSLFFLGMTLAAIALTTIDTYIMTLEQMYYELSIYAHAEEHRWYIPEWLFKRKAIRGAGGLAAATSLGLSFLIPATGIYAWGTLALGAVVPATPLLVFRALELEVSYHWKPQIYGLLSSICLVPLIYAILGRHLLFLGADPYEHLYLLVLSLGAGTSCGYAVSWGIWRFRRVAG